MVTVNHPQEMKNNYTQYNIWNSPGALGGHNYSLYRNDYDSGKTEYFLFEEISDCSSGGWRFSEKTYEITNSEADRIYNAARDSSLFIAAQIATENAEENE